VAFLEADVIVQQLPEPVRGLQGGPSPTGRDAVDRGADPRVLVADARCGLAPVALHRGMTIGVLERLDRTTRLAGFVPKHPYRAGCLVDVTLAPAGPDAA
jgi:hypothetical protein